MTRDAAIVARKKQIKKLRRRLLATGLDQHLHEPPGGYSVVQRAMLAHLSELRADRNRLMRRQVLGCV